MSGIATAGGVAEGREVLVGQGECLFPCAKPYYKEPLVLAGGSGATVVDADGREWEFQGGSFAGFTPSHVREHQVLAAPIKVRFVDEGEVLRIVAIEDG